MKKILAIICLALAGGVVASDVTPYQMSVGGNGYGGSPYSTWNVTIMPRKFVEFYDCAEAFGYTDLKRIWDTATVLKPLMHNFLGPYMSPHEISLLCPTPRAGCATTYAQRMAEAYAGNWYYRYMVDYLQDTLSPAVDPESLVIHGGNDSWTITFDGATRTNYLTNAQMKRRLSYQYWNNPPGDADLYPAGYLWYANGACQSTADAAANAMYRYIIHDSATVGVGPMDGHWGVVFYDNYQGFSPPMEKNGYVTFNAATGGRAAGGEVTEETGYDSTIGGVIQSWRTGATARKWWQKSAWHISAEIDRKLAAHGYIGWANSMASYDYADGYYNNPVTMLADMIDSVSGVSFEGPPDPSKGYYAWSWFHQQYALIRAKDRYSNTAFQSELIATAYLSSDFRRTVYAYFCAWMDMRNGKAFMSPFRSWTKGEKIDDSISMCLYKNFGEYHGDPTVTDNGSGRWLYVRDYDSGEVKIYFLTPGNATDLTASVTVTPGTGKTGGTTWYAFDPVTGLFSGAGATSFTINPFRGLIVADRPNWAGPYYSQPYSYTPDVTPRISLSPGTMYFAGIVGEANPASQQLHIRNIGGGTMDWQAAHTGGAWLDFTNQIGTGNDDSVEVPVVTTGLTAGVYTGTIVIGAPGAANTPQTANVRLTMTDPPVGTPRIGTVPPDTMYFTAEVSGTMPVAQDFWILNVGAGTLNWTVANDSSWLTLTPDSGGGGFATVRCSVFLATAHDTGCYYDNIVVTSVGTPAADNSPDTCMVELHMTPHTPFPEPIKTIRRIFGIRVVKP